MKLHPIHPLREEIAAVALDPKHSATYLATMALGYMRDCTTPFQSVAADAAICALFAEIQRMEDDEQNKRKGAGYRIDHKKAVAREIIIQQRAESAAQTRKRIPKKEAE